MILDHCALMAAACKIIWGAGVAGVAAKGKLRERDQLPGQADPKQRFYIRYQAVIRAQVLVIVDYYHERLRAYDYLVSNIEPFSWN